ncbi:MAG: efflux RND transporter periplasmic adaptor subunit [Bryobacteraceae bacterium]|nr:efflux RND transporter periplasmic adaptor subunit [Bryobacteraceae bacterium]
MKAFLLLVPAAALTLPGCRTNETAAAVTSEPAPALVKLIPVQPQAFSATVPITGTLVSTSQVEVKAETTGRVVRFAREEGERVAAGEAVVWVDETNYQLAVSQAEAAVKVAQAALEKTRVAEAHAGSELERSRNLEKSGGITDRDLKAAEVAERDARAQVALGEAQLEQAQAAAETARKRLRDAVIHAPVAGEIQNKHVRVGAYVEAPTALFSLVDNSRLELESLVATSELAPIRAGQSVAFTVNSYPGMSFGGRVIEVNPAIDQQTRSAKVRIQAANRDGRLRAGMFAQGEILVGVQPNAIVVPADAVYRDDRTAREGFVFVYDQDKAARRAVRIGREKQGALEIIEGLKTGDLLIAEQSIEIAEGVRVQPR